LCLEGLLGGVLMIAELYFTALLFCLKAPVLLKITHSGITKREEFGSLKGAKLI
jgi:hypothetical protein